MATFRFISLLVFLSLLPTQSFAVDKVFAAVSRVEGKGSARIRRVMGTEAIVGKQMEVHVGDRIITDDSSTVEIVLHDGTLIRIGIRSEFKVSEATATKDEHSWVFNLAGGSIRALVEKSLDHKATKVRVNTAAATVGIHGTEILLQHSLESGITSLFTLEGPVEFGSLGCDKTKTCLEVKEGTSSTIHLGDKNPTAPVKYGPREILGLSKAASGGAKGQQTQSLAIERLALFQDLSHADVAFVATMSEAELASTLKKAQDSLQSTQDQILGRSEEIRRAMYAAMKAGTYDDVMKVAEAYVDLRNGRDGITEFEASNLGVLGAAKFALAKAILESSAFSQEKAATVTSTISSGKAQKTSTSTTESATVQVTKVSDEEINALVSKKSDSLERALKWARTVPTKIVPIGTPSAAELSSATAAAAAYKPATATEKILSASSYVHSFLANYHVILAVAQANMIFGDCDLACGVEAIHGAGTALGAGGSRPSVTTSTNTSINADKVLCSNPTTVCTYQPCSSRAGKNCTPVKVCKTACQ
ncbi:MAG: FecR family protein [Bdellovibrionota bacterium]